jgi:hypothetical protein
MHIYGLLDEMGQLTERLNDAIAQLHDRDERQRLQAFPMRYEMIDYQIRNQLQLISIAMMETDYD